MKLDLFFVFAWFLAGSVAEVLNTIIRRWSVGALGVQNPVYAVAGILGGFILRLVGTALVLVLAFRHSVTSGLAALVGYWIWRWIMIWRINRRLSAGEGRPS